MFRKILDIAAILAFVGVALLYSFSRGSPLGAWNGGTSHTNSQFDAIGGFSVNGTAVISSSTAFTATSITNTGALTQSGQATLSGASNTLSATNLISNSTSTGLVLRGTDGVCYLLRLGTSGAFGTSTASCQ